MATVAKKDTKKKKSVVKKPKKVLAKKDSFVPTLYKDDELDPRKILFEAYFINPESPTFGKALPSAVKAGYSKTYADNILHFRPQWILDIIGRMDAVKFVRIARENLERDLNMNTVEQAMGAFGPIFGKDKDGNKVPVMTENVKKMELKQKATFFVSEKADPLFNKSKKDDGTIKVDIKQIIIITPNGQQSTYNPADREAIPSVPATA